MTYKFKYALKLSKDVKMLMSLYKSKDGLVAKSALFTLIDGTWIMLNKPTETKIGIRRNQPYFRKRLPRNYKSLHSELFYVDEFVEITD